MDGSRLLIEKRVTLDLSRWIGKALDDGLSTEQALAELRGRAVPWQADDARASQPAASKRGAGKGSANEGSAKKESANKRSANKPKAPRA